MPVTTLDGHVASEGVERVGRLNIDVESLEHRVLRGAAAVLEHHRPIVCFELLPVGDAAAIEAIRVQYAYVVAGLGERHVTWAAVSACGNLNGTRFWCPPRRWTTGSPACPHTSRWIEAPG